MIFKFSEQFTVSSEQEPWKREGFRAGLYGAPGSTKSYSAAAFLIEPFLQQGGTIVIFQPRSEWHTLKEKFPDVQVVGGPYNQDVSFSASHPKLYADAVVEQGVSMVFYTPDVDEEEKLIGFVEHFLDYVMKGQEVTHRPLMIVLEEAHEYAPRTPSGHVAAPWVFNRMVKRCKDVWTGGRKLNIVPVAITQRPQELHFAIRQLCNLSLYGQFSPQDLAYVDKECLSHYRKEGLDIDAGQLKDLSAGKFLIIHHGQAYYEQRTVGRITPHGADTPSLAHVPSASEAVQKTVTDLGLKLKELLERQAQEESELEKAKHTISTQAKLFEEQAEKLKTMGNLRDLLVQGDGDPAKIKEAYDRGCEEGQATVRKELEKAEKEKYGWEEQVVRLQEERDRARAELEPLQKFEAALTAFSGPIVDRVVDDFQHIWVTKIAHQVFDMVMEKIPTALPTVVHTEVEDRTVRANLDPWLKNPHTPETAKRMLQVFQNMPRGVTLAYGELVTRAGYSVKSSAPRMGIQFLKRNKLVTNTSSGLKLAGE